MLFNTTTHTHTHTPLDSFSSSNCERWNAHERDLLLHARCDPVLSTCNGQAGAVSCSPSCASQHSGDRFSLQWLSFVSCNNNNNNNNNNNTCSTRCRRCDRPTSTEPTAVVHAQVQPDCPYHVGSGGSRAKGRRETRAALPSINGRGGPTDRQTDRQTDGQTDGPTDDRRATGYRKL